MDKDVGFWYVIVIVCPIGLYLVVSRKKLLKYYGLAMFFHGDEPELHADDTLATLSCLPLMVITASLVTIANIMITYRPGLTTDSVYVGFFSSVTVTFALALFERFTCRSLTILVQSIRFELLQLHPRRINQLLFSDVQKEYIEHLKPQIWFNMVAYISKANDGVRSYHEQHRWLECFILPLDLKASSKAFEDFHNAHVAFELAPAEFTERVERFSELLETRDLCRLLMENLGNNTDKDERYSKLRFWISLQANILDIMQPPGDSMTSTTISAHDLVFSDRIQSSLQQFRKSGPAHSHFSAADQLEKFLNRLTNDDELQTTHGIEKSWKEEHRMSLLHVFNSVKDSPDFQDISTLLVRASEDPRLLSAEQDKFRSNVCLFVEAKTGRKGLQYREAIKTLREMSFMKNEQSKILYEAIEKQRTEIALQQQIITCLEYRHAIEELPQKNVPIMTALAGTNSGTGAWEKMWKLSVERELDSMIADYIIPPNSVPLPATSTTTVSPAGGIPAIGVTSTLSAAPSAISTPSSTPPPASSYLRALLQSDFSYWAKACTQLNTDKKNKNVRTATSTNTAGAGAAAGPGSGSAVTGSTSAGTAPAKAPRRPKAAPPAAVQTWTTGNFFQVDFYKPDYETWPSFQQGLNLYSELSANIHTYNKSYEIHEMNFTRSHRLILQWLKPDLDTIDPNTKKVDWEKVWKKRGLPT